MAEEYPPDTPEQAARARAEGQTVALGHYEHPADEPNMYLLAREKQDRIEAALDDGPADAFTEELVLRLVDAASVLASAREANGIGGLNVDVGSLLSALDSALRGSSGCIEPEEWQEQRRRALAAHGDYLGLGWGS